MLNTYVAKQICIAQICSDSGKGIYELTMKDEDTLSTAERQGYLGKDIAIQRAISKINSLKEKSGFHFYVTRDKGMMNCPCLIYFSYYMNGKRYQVSFHSYNYGFKRYIMKGTTHHQKWDRGSSRINCEKLIQQFQF